MATHIALLRGINVGGKHRLPMAELRGLFEQAGAGEVRTYIQSGNVVFEAAAAAAKAVPGAVADAIESRFGFPAPVIVRTAAQWKRLVRANPFVRSGAKPEHLYAGVLARRAPAARVRAFDPPCGPGEALDVHGAEIYLHLPNGVARTKLTNALFDRTFGTVCTVRNWKTVLQLLELAGG